MPVYRVKIEGDEKDFVIVRAATAAAARRHVAVAEPMSADDVADAVAAGHTIVTAAAAPASDGED